ncbi:hypothetical protein RhiirA4_480866 [Rhizophagus irregularis]|uniref:C2H2-type domain-containing protein n=2 Tax=Rhizophagus irregularis TaxID=588596 RepID=A0A2I1HIM3_9GLOM|nr:hypothetical protein RhiirA4_480866 [Rhizophagus irregularis]
MFICPFQQCPRTFSRQPALREHTKTHQGQAYWKILNRITENSHNIVEDIRVDYSDENITFEMEDEHEDNFTVNEIDVDERDVDEHDVDEHDVDNTNEILEYAIEAEEEPDFEQHINNYTLQIPEITYQITSIDTKSVSDHSISQFPDTAYAEFMKLVSTHHFSNSAGNDILKWFQKNYLRENVVLPANTTQGHEFVNSMNIEHLLYLKTKILEYEDEEYYLHHQYIDDDDDGRVYGEQWSGMWWERTQNSLGTSVKKILSIILYSDATTLDHLGKSSEHPIYLSLGNIPNWRRNKCDAKALLGFLPKLKQIHNRKDNKRSFASAKRMLYQHCFDIMTKPIYEKLESSGLDIMMTDDQII